MAEFNIARIRYTWKNYWTGATVYTKDDVVRVGGNTYICMIGHTSDPTDFPTDLNYSPKSRWLLHTEGYTWRNEWQAATIYNKNDLVKYGAVKGSYISIKRLIRCHPFSKSDYYDPV